MAPVNRNKVKNVVDKRIKMLIRRLKKVQEGYNLLKEQNDEIVAKFIEQSRTNSDLELKNQQLLKDVMDLTFNTNHLKGILHNVDNNIVNCLKPLGELSSSLLNAKRLLTEDNDLMYGNKGESSGNNLFSPGSSVRAHAMVNPMVQGYVIRHPVVSIRKYKTPEELHSMKKEIRSTRALYNENDVLSPIPENPPDSGARRKGRLGRTRFSSSPVYSSSEQANEVRVENSVSADNINCNLVPLVRLRDVSTLLQNSSVVILDQNDMDVLNVSSEDSEPRMSTQEMTFNASNSGTRLSTRIKNSTEHGLNEDTLIVNENEPSIVFSDNYQTPKRNRLSSIIPSSGSTEDSPCFIPSASTSSSSDLNFTPKFNKISSVKRRKALVPEDFTPKIKKNVKNKKNISKIKKEPISARNTFEEDTDGQNLEQVSEKITKKIKSELKTSKEEYRNDSESVQASASRPRRNVKVASYKEEKLNVKKRRSRSVKL